LLRSGYDLLVLDATPGHVDKADGMFPKIGRCEEFGGSLSRMWTAFSEQQELIQKTGGTTAAEVCHDAATVADSARLEDAADLIVRRKVHRLAVVDAKGKCVGVLSRGDILKATLNVRLLAFACKRAACADAFPRTQRLRAMNGPPR
jgi:CBS-domain-containing membrane protein